MGQITELLANAPSTFSVLAGDDALALPVIALGGTGLVSVASNAIPGAMSSMVNAALAGDWVSARDLNKRYFALMQAHFIEPSPAPIKAVLALLGRCSETLRLPMVPVTEATRTKLKSLLHDPQPPAQQPKRLAFLVPLSLRSFASTGTTFRSSRRTICRLICTSSPEIANWSSTSTVRIPS